MKNYHSPRTVCIMPFRFAIVNFFRFPYQVRIPNIFLCNTIVFYRFLMRFLQRIFFYFSPVLFQRMVHCSKHSLKNCSDFPFFQASSTVFRSVSQVFSTPAKSPLSTADAKDGHTGIFPSTGTDNSAAISSI